MKAAEMSPYFKHRKDQAVVRLLTHLVINGETAQKDMSNILGVTEKQVYRVVKRARENNFIRLTRTEDTPKRGTPRNYYALTLEGLIIALAYNPELWSQYDKIASAPRHRTLLPLVFGKLHLFKDINIEPWLTLDAYLQRKLEIAFHRVAEPLWENASMKQIREDNKQAIYLELKEKGIPETHTKKLLDDVIKRADEMMDSRRIDQEIYLYVYFDWDSGVNPFTIYTYIGLDMARKVWNSPIGSPSDITPMVSPKILLSIMEVAKKDPELREFFETTVRNRTVYADSTITSVRLLRMYWEDLELFPPVSP